MIDISYTIARYEQISKDVFLVAFNIKPQDLSTFYLESSLEISEISGKTPNEICQLAYNKLKSKIDEILIKLENEKLTIVGYQFIPE